MTALPSWGTRRIVLSKRPFASLAASLLLGLAATAAAQPSGGAYQAYPLQHKQVADVVPQLRAMLEDLRPQPAVVPDASKNQVLVQGDAMAQRIAAQFLESIDVPAEPRKLPATEPMVRAYRQAPEKLDEIAVQLQRRYADDPQVRLTTDLETSQLIVLAPAEVHAQIQQTLASGGNTPAGSPQRSRLGMPVRPADRLVTLQHMPAERVLPQMQSLLGARLQAAATDANRPTAFVFRGSEERQAVVEIDANHRVRLAGDPPIVEQLSRLIAVLDRPETPAAGSPASVRILPVRRTDPAKLQAAIEAYRRGKPAASDRTAAPLDHGSQLLDRMPGPIRLVQMLQPDPQPGQLEGPPDLAQPIPNQPPDEPAEPMLRELGDRVQFETLPDLDVIILRGRDADVDEVTRMIEEIERLSAETIPELDVYQLKNVHCLSLVSIIELVAEDLIGGRQGKIHVTPLVKPNALLLVGWGEAVEAMKTLIARLDQPVPPETQLRVYRLRSAPVTEAAATVQDAFGDAQGLAARIFVVPDIRTNSLIVRAAPRDLRELDLLIERIDQGSSGLINQARIFKLKNSLASDLATTLQAAINAGSGGTAGARSTVLELITADVQGQRMLKSGVLADVQVTPDPHTNALMITAPSESMDLLEALIEQLDSPTAVAQIKVFRIVNGDASSLIEMLRTLLPGELTVAGPQLAGAEGETTLVPVRFSVDTRTNSIIATGSQGDLAIIEALLLRLDEDDSVERRNTVYQLKNSPAFDVAASINELLRSTRTIEQAAPGIVSPFEQVEKEVIVVPEPVSNSLIISATPRYYEEVLRVVEELDAQPAQVMIQVVIAEVSLDDFDEFGIEMGLQDSVLFDRSLLSQLETITRTITTPSAGGAITLTEQEIIAATNTPGFDFNNQPLGNAGSDRSFASSNIIGTQGLSTFGVGRVSSDLGYGGFVFSASSESVSMLIRALQQSRRVEVLGRPQIMTLDNQSAFIQVGERVPRITGSRFDGRVQTNSVELENTGIILGVTPRISPEGMVVMEVDAEKSRVGSEQDGIPVSVVEGDVIRSPKIKVTTAQTTVFAASGETIVLGGLITKEQETIHRSVPYLSQIPILGNLFRYDSSSAIRNELLIFLTPHVIRNSCDLERIKQAEAARMSWCLADVHELHGPTGIYEDTDSSSWNGCGEVVYPDTNPEGMIPGAFTPQDVPIENLELLPAPSTLDIEEPMPGGTEGPRVPPRPESSEPTVQPTGYSQPVYGPPATSPDPRWSPDAYPPAGEARRAPAGYDLPNEYGAPAGYDVPARDASPPWSQSGDPR